MHGQRGDRKNVDRAENATDLDLSDKLSLVCFCQALNCTLLECIAEEEPVATVLWIA